MREQYQDGLPVGGTIAEMGPWYAKASQVHRVSTPNAEGIRAHEVLDSGEAADRLNALEARAQAATALLEALKYWEVLLDRGMRTSGVGIGSVSIRKWDADEARFFTRKAIADYEKVVKG